MFPSAPAARDTGTATPSVATPKRTFGAPIIKRYREFCYRLLGERIDRGKPSEALAGRLAQAGMHSTPGMHQSVIVVTMVLAGIDALVVTLLLFGVILGSSEWFGYVAVITALTVGMVLIAFEFLVRSRISNRKSELERELPFTFSELSVFASTGMSPIELMRRMAGRTHDPEMTAEFKIVVYKTDVQGKDLITALAETAKSSPSNSLREALWDLANMIHQGGNLDAYLRSKSDDILNLKRLVQREFIERLQTFVDMYVSLVLVGVLMIAVTAFLLNSFGSTADGLDANSLLLLLTFGLVPLAVILTTVMIGVAYARSE
jgi:archaeal flagellar protein FlaJ